MDTPVRRYDRYPGARPFADDAVEQELFFGRDRETHELLHQILSTQLLVVYGKSGLGKTSLMQAGLFPRLRDRDFLPLPVRLHDLEQPPLDVFFQAIAEACQRHDIDYTPGETTSLWEFFKTALFLRGEALQLPVLVIDQFEELFTLQDAQRRAVITQELADLTGPRLPENIRARRRAGESLPYSDRPPEVKIAFVIREDHLGALQELTGPIPTILEQRYRLTEFDEQQARAAMEAPAQVEDEGLYNTRAFRYEAHVIDQMLQFLRGRSGIIEPFQLQILCQYIEQQVERQQAEGQSQVLVNESYLGDDRAMQRILQNFYRDALQKVPAKRQRKRAARLCEEGLLNPQGQRLSLEEGELKRIYRVSAETLDTLVDVRLLRKEPRLESFYYEISHDSLAQSVANSRRFRVPKQVWYGGAACAVLILLGFILITQQLRVTTLRAQQAELREQFLSDQLAKNFWNKALHERDENNEPLKASFNFMRAATHATQPGMATNAELAGAILVQNSSLSAILSFPGNISSAAFQPHGTSILIQRDDGAMHLWNVTTATVSPVPDLDIKNIPSQSSKTVWSPDGNRFLTWADQTAELRERDSNALVARLSGHKSAIWGAAFHPDGDQILTWGADGTAWLWDPVTATGITLRHDGIVRGAMYSPDGRRVLTWSDDATAQVWDHVTGAPLTPPLSHTRRVWEAAFSADGQQILTWSADGAARVWDSHSGVAITAPLAHKASVKGAIFALKGKRVLTWSDDRTARMWDSATGAALTPPLYHPGVIGAALSPEGDQMLTWSPDGAVRLWAYIPDRVLSLPLGPQSQMAQMAALSPDGKHILTLSRDGDVQLWDSATGAARMLPSAPPAHFRGALFRPNAKQLLAWTDNGRIRLWQIEANEIRLLSAVRAKTTWAAAFSPGKTTWGAIFSPDGETNSHLGRHRGWNGRVMA